MEEYSTMDVVRILGITRGRIREWINEAYIFPSISESPGQGKSHVFNRWDLYGIWMVEELIVQGFRRDQCGMAYNWWSRKTYNWDPEKRLDIKGLAYIQLPFEPTKIQLSGNSAAEGTGATYFVLIIEKGYPARGCMELFTDQVSEAVNKSRFFSTINMKQIIHEVDDMLERYSKNKNWRVDIGKE